MKARDYAKWKSCATSLKWREALVFLPSMYHDQNCNKDKICDSKTLTPRELTSLKMCLQGKKNKNNSLINNFTCI